MYSLLHRARNWIEGFALKPLSSVALLLIAFLEGSLFPVAPDFLLVPLCLARPKRSFWYALVVALGSTVGAALGYFIGMRLFDAVGAELLNFFGWQSVF